ncbi:hypothetical protein R5R35_004941 [Gryllus longicercus]|uniref:Transglutaminase-like domain-containing protein n=1 Tax=Gryllus longicercus TaxID=2509291 RepID=A0AAN9Z6V4_9ORTH
MAASDARSQESAESARCRLYARLCDDLGRRQRSAPNATATAALAGELPEGERALRVQLCELYGVENGFSHNTQRYFEAAAAAGAAAGAAAIGGVGSGAAVLRRGLPFALALRFDRPCDTSSDALTFIFTFEGNKRSSRELVAVINVDPIELPRGDNKEWYAAVQTAQMRDKNTATFKVMIPCSARVGIWNLTVRTYKTDLKGIRIPHTLNEYHSPDFIYVLFNPWCKEDGVYLPGEASRRECVQASEGKVWLGCARDPVSAPWVFAQYAPAVLPCAVLLLQAAGVAPALRGDPARVAHALARAVATRLVTFKDDDGVPVDSWARERANDGVPGQWTGSVAILEEYLRTLQPVRCTQSWVHSPLVVTVCRALGIPCRSVTNYESAHGCDDSLAIDCEITRHGLRPLLVGNAADEVWSFQMWNEVWAARPDLPEAYSGWQAVDATLPAANGRAGSGPAPVEAIKHGLLGLGDEVRTLHARVNGDRFLFQENPDDPDWLLHPVHQEQDAVGFLIVTKKVSKDDEKGDTDIDDITQQYKYLKERTGLNNLKPSIRKEAALDYNLAAPEVTFELMVGKTTFGQDITISLHVHNQSTDPRRVTVTCVLLARAVDCRGGHAARLKREEGTLMMRGGQREKIQLQATAAEYLGKVRPEGLVRVFALARVQETRQAWVQERTILLRKPRISVQPRSPAVEGREVTLAFTFANPLAVPLTECSYRVEGSSCPPRAAPFRDVLPGEVVTFEETVVLRQPGDHRLTASFCSRELGGVVGRGVVPVQAA